MEARTNKENNIINKITGNKEILEYKEIKDHRELPFMVHHLQSTTFTTVRFQTTFTTKMRTRYPMIKPHLSK